MKSNNKRPDGFSRFHKQTNKQTNKQSINIDYYYCKNSHGCHEISVKARSCFSDYHLSLESLTSVKDIVVWACCPPWNWKLKISSKGFENPELEPRPPNPLENSPKKLIKNKCSYFRFFRQELFQVTKINSSKIFLFGGIIYRGGGENFIHPPLDKSVGGINANI